MPTELDPLVFRGRRVALGHPVLKCKRAGDRLDDARELYQHAVPGGLDDPALVLGDLRIDQLAAMRPEPRQSAGFVPSHQPAVPRDIGRENGREPAFDPLFAQGSLPRGRYALGPPSEQSAPAAGTDQRCNYLL
jgi:hypothetical protein